MHAVPSAVWLMHVHWLRLLLPGPVWPSVGMPPKRYQCCTAMGTKLRMGSRNSAACLLPPACRVPLSCIHKWPECGLPDRPTHRRPTIPPALLSHLGPRRLPGHIHYLVPCLLFHQSGGQAAGKPGRVQRGCRHPSIGQVAGSCLLHAGTPAVQQAGTVSAAAADPATCPALTPARSQGFFPMSNRLSKDSNSNTLPAAHATCPALAP